MLLLAVLVWILLASIVSLEANMRGLNAILADQSGADRGEAAQGHQPTWLLPRAVRERMDSRQPAALQRTPIDTRNNRQYQPRRPAHLDHGN